MRCSLSSRLWAGNTDSRDLQIICQIKSRKPIRDCLAHVRFVMSGLLLKALPGLSCLGQNSRGIFSRALWKWFLLTANDSATRKCLSAKGCAAVCGLQWQGNLTSNERVHDRFSRERFVDVCMCESASLHDVPHIIWTCVHSETVD